MTIDKYRKVITTTKIITKCNKYKIHLYQIMEVYPIMRYKVDFILLARFLKFIPVELVQILNIHYSLLPAFGGKGYYGMKVHQAIFACRARYVQFCFLFLAFLPFIKVVTLEKTCNVDIFILVLSIPLAY